MSSSPKDTARAVDSNSSLQKRRRSRSATDSDGRRRSPPAPSPKEADRRDEAPSEDAPPLPDEAPPEDDGWEPIWDANAQAYYFFNRFTQASQWDNPRVPEASANGYGAGTSTSSGFGAYGSSSSGAPGTSSPPKRRHGGYNPAIHGSYDPNADYAKEAEREEEEEEAAAAAAVAAAAAGLANPTQELSVSGHFNRFTGRFQGAAQNPERHNDENKSHRQLSAFFDVDAAANAHDGRSLKAERQNKKLSKQEVKAFREKRREKKEEKRRAWLRD
ncbi:uncharacterized protein BDR25DRAFT_308146 [Lindgomyces ingoldianus]|uniref:Uncharacterized protein n=1 Tax=Lindgomyces ingoldianus TaxID=673940 RepID=A0ACB6Q7G7_9PLEO|nr:uncharacterized protein BDR25DRAFT_308146 [Lindgomyces ingoldianus]KAF2462767.1 hypothetical protein BDR25DRAFT_308146 [Lindgomyces ingoldianus]